MVTFSCYCFESGRVAFLTVQYNHAFVGIDVLIVHIYGVLV